MSQLRNAIAVVLAAGVGRRLGAAHEGPKMLLEFDGRTLLDRRLAALAACGVEQVSITVGHEADRIRAEAARLDPPLDVRFVENPRYREGSLVSLAVQREALTAGRPVLVMDGDVLHDARMVARLWEGGAENTLLMDPGLEPGDEPVKVCLRGDRIVDFRKRPDDPGERHGESVGFFRLSPQTAAELSARCDEKIAAGGAHLEYEEALRDLMLADPKSGSGRWGVADVGDLPWTEIDFEDDVAKARDIVLPQLTD